MKLVQQKSYFLSVIFIMLFSSAIAQYDEDDARRGATTVSQNPDKPSFKERLYYGGNVSFNILNSYLFLETSPIVGYKITENLSAGIGGKLLFARDLIYKENFTIFGGSVFTRYRLFSQVFLHAEFESLSAYERQFNNPNYGQRAPANMFFVGGGYSSGGGFGVQIMLLYDLINHPNSPYQSSYLLGNNGPPIIFKFGFTIGF